MNIGQKVVCVDDQNFLAPHLMEEFPKKDEKSTPCVAPSPPSTNTGTPKTFSSKNSAIQLPRTGSNMASTRSASASFKKTRSNWRRKKKRRLIVGSIDSLTSREHAKETVVRPQRGRALISKRGRRPFRKRAGLPSTQSFAALLRVIRHQFSSDRKKGAKNINQSAEAPKQWPQASSRRG